MHLVVKGIMFQCSNYKLLILSISGSTIEWFLMFDHVFYYPFSLSYQKVLVMNVMHALSGEDINKQAVQH